MLNHELLGQDIREWTWTRTLIPQNSPSPFSSIIRALVWKNPMVQKQGTACISYKGLQEATEALTSKTVGDRPTSETSSGSVACSSLCARGCHLRCFQAAALTPHRNDLLLPSFFSFCPLYSSIKLQMVQKVITFSGSSITEFTFSYKVPWWSTAWNELSSILHWCCN